MADLPDTAVPRPSFGDQGFIAPLDSAILEGVQTDINNAFGGNLNPGLSTPQGQIASTESAIISDSYSTFLQYVNEVDPALNSGRMQDGIGRIYYMKRIAAQPTVVQGVCSGLDGVIIPVAALIKAPDGNLYVSQGSGTITDGTVTIPFACAINGAIPAPASVDWTIQQAVFGWDSVVTLADGVLGRLVESPSQFETRRAASVAANARGILDAIEGKVLNLDNVLDGYTTENVEAYPVLIKGKVLGANSIYVAVVGGDDLDVATAIWTKKAPGAGYNGNTTETVVDPNPAYVLPAPSYQVTFERPTTIDVAFLVVIKNSSAVPADALTQIQKAIIGAFAGTDGGTRAQIGSIIFASRYYATVAKLGSWATIVDIQLGRAGTAASFTAAIAGSVMTVSAVASGTLAVGQLILDNAANVASGTTIINQLTGPGGGTGTYTVSVNQSVTSEAMTATTLFNDITMNIDESPATSAPDIALLLV